MLAMQSPDDPRDLSFWRALRRRVIARGRLRVTPPLTFNGRTISVAPRPGHVPIRLNSGGGGGVYNATAVDGNWSGTAYEYNKDANLVGMIALARPDGDKAMRFIFHRAGLAYSPPPIYLCSTCTSGGQANLVARSLIDQKVLLTQAYYWAAGGTTNLSAQDYAIQYLLDNGYPAADPAKLSDYLTAYTDAQTQQAIVMAKYWPSTLTMSGLFGDVLMGLDLNRTPIDFSDPFYQGAGQIYYGGTTKNYHGYDICSNPENPPIVSMPVKIDFVLSCGPVDYLPSGQPNTSSPRVVFGVKCRWGVGSYKSYCHFTLDANCKPILPLAPDPPPKPYNCDRLYVIPVRPVPKPPCFACDEKTDGGYVPHPPASYPDPTNPNAFQWYTSDGSGNPRVQTGPNDAYPIAANFSYGTGFMRSYSSGYMFDVSGNQCNRPVLMTFDGMHDPDGNSGSVVIHE